MPSQFLTNSSSAIPSSSDLPDDPVSTATTSSSPDMWNYLWIPILISLSKDLSSARAASSPHSILLPSQSDSSSAASLSVPRCPAIDPKLNYQPVIGILSHPGDGASGRLNNATNASYIAASYVKFVESAGARVIPLIYNEPREILFEKLNLVNGVLFTGGWAKSGLYFDTVRAIFEKTLARNDAGYHFPLYAICLGFELLTMIISKDSNILEQFSATDQASTLQFMKNVNIEGTVFQRFPPDLLNKLSSECLVMQNHHCFRSCDLLRASAALAVANWSEFDIKSLSIQKFEEYGISPGRLQEIQALSSFFKILTTSADENNKVYVSTVQAYSYPVTAFQWHPEKNAFEWGLSMIPHSEEAIQVTQHVANFFVSEARKSLNRPPIRKVLDNLIYNYSPTYCGKAGKGYDEVYIFT